MAKCNQLTSLPFKGLKLVIRSSYFGKTDSHWRRDGSIGKCGRL